MERSNECIESVVYLILELSWLMEVREEREPARVFKRWDITTKG